MSYLVFLESENVKMGLTLFKLFIDYFLGNTIIHLPNTLSQGTLVVR